MTMLFHDQRRLGEPSEGRRGHPVLWAVFVAALVIAIAHLLA